MHYSDRSANRGGAIAAVLDEITDSLSSAIDWRRSIERTLSFLCDAMPGEAIVLATCVDEWHVFCCTELEDLDELELLLQQQFQIMAGDAYSGAGVRASRNNGIRRAVRETDGISTSYMSVPVIGAGQVLGVLHLRCAKPCAYTREDVTVASIIASKIGHYLADVAGSRRAGALPREDQELIRATLDSLSASIAILDRDGVILYTNSAWRNFAVENGYEGRPDTIGMNYLSVCDGAVVRGDELARAAATGIREVMAGRRALFTLEYPCHSPDEKRWFILRVTGFTGSQEGRVVVAHENITERKLAEEALKESERKYRELFENANDAIFLHSLPEEDTSPRFLEVNEVACRRLGYSREELLGMSFRDIDAPDRRDEATNAMERVIETGHATFEMVHVAKDGSQVPVEISSHLYTTDAGRVVLSIARDITERKRAAFELALAREEAVMRAEEMTVLKTEAEARTEEMTWLRAEAELRAQEAEEGKRILESLMEYIPEGIAIADAPNVEIRLISKSGMEMGGYSEDAVSGAKPGEVISRHGFLHQDGVTPASEKELPLTRATRHAETVKNEEWIIKRPDGTLVPILCSAGPIRDLSGNIIGGIATWREIVEMKAAQKGLEDAYEREHHIADVLQRALIPTVSRTLHGYAISAAYQPALEEAEVGGDFYDVFDLPDGRTAILMGDVSGKGLKAAEYTAMVKYTVRGFAQEDPEPESVLSRLNNVMDYYVSDDLFVTTFYGVLDTPRNTLTYANGGHEQPLLYSHARGCVVPLDVTGRAVGILSGGVYSPRTQKLTPGDIVLLYTDGITDAGSPGELFGVERLSQVLVANCEKSEQQIVDAVFDAAREFGSDRLHDDAAVLVLKAEAGQH